MSFLIAVGTAIAISSEVGKGSRENANRYFSQGIILVLAAGLILTATYATLHVSVPNIFDAPDDVNGHLRDYFFYMCFRPLPLMLNTYFYDIILKEGGERLCAGSSIVQIAVNIILSIALCSTMGIGGISLASVLSDMLSLGVLGVFFFSKHNMLRFQWTLQWHAVIRVFKYSIVNASIHLHLGIMQFVMNIFLLRQFGTDAVIIFTVIVNVQGLLIAIFDSIGESIMPLVTVYRGENCQKGIIKSMRVANKAALIEGIAATVVLLLFAGFIPGIFGITTPDLISQAALAIRLYSLAAIALAFVMLYTAYYLFIENIALSLVTTLLQLLALPLALGIPLSSIFGVNGVCVAFVASSFVSLAFLAASAKKLSTEKTFPLLLDSGALNRELSYDVPKTKTGIMDLVYSVERDLLQRGIDKKKVLKIMLMIEETEMFAIEHGEERDKTIECNIIIEDAVTLILRDSGKQIISVNEDEDVTSMATYVYTRIISSHKEKDHILTGGKNRIIYKF